ncbi:hypothetical protein [Enterococcus avium]|uniref:hypothetical protein n=1 Tax=Enterococcus avium TaxID=33945 RepID=UPI0022E4A9FA|nr:hypothetical protein [Enterococcus avium]
MRFLEIVTKLGGSAKDETEKELLRSYYERLREMIRRDCSNDEIEHRFCLMITCFILRYISKEVDYSRTSAEYFMPFLKSRLVSEVIA